MLVKFLQSLFLFPAGILPKGGNRFCASFSDSQVFLGKSIYLKMFRPHQRNIRHYFRFFFDDALFAPFISSMLNR